MNPEEFFSVADYSAMAKAAISEDQDRLDAARLTAELNSPSQRRLDSGKRLMSESPLFGGDSQLDLFGGKE
jgi:hypothetical protein